MDWSDSYQKAQTISQSVGATAKFSLSSCVERVIVPTPGD